MRKTYDIATRTDLVAIVRQFFATIFVTNATTHRCCNICLNITTNTYYVGRPSLYGNKMTASRNGASLSQNRDCIPTAMQIVAIGGLYRNKMIIYGDQKESWQYDRPITTTGEFVVTLDYIATKNRCSDRFCGNRPDFL